MIENFQTPDLIFGELFRDVQTARIFRDSKTFSDCIPKMHPVDILRKYVIKRQQPAFSLYEFVLQHFDVPAHRSTDFNSSEVQPIEVHMERMWSVLSRSEDRSIPGGSLIPLPYPYIVAGGRRREIYYWESYFTQLGLYASGKMDMVGHMVKNFAFLINTLGHVPSGNRTYFVSRSQPPFFAYMVELLAISKGEEIYKTYFSELEKEYAFWMDGHQTMQPGQSSYRRLVRLGADEYLNRYFDDKNTPRPENYIEDVHLAGQASRSQADFYRDLRSACESGWNFSSRWCDVAGDLTTIKTTHILPVDLNVCILKLEEVLLKCYQLIGDQGKIGALNAQLQKREQLIIRYFWRDEPGYFFDYDFVKQTHTSSIHAAGLFPLFGEVATKPMARQCIDFVRKKLWMNGGIAATNLRTGQVWDSPYGWAPLQWIAYQGMFKYGFRTDAKELATTWTDLVLKTFQRTGNLMEKYNVFDSTEVHGGEHDVQAGFGWTNGVHLAMLKELRMSDQ